MPEMQKVVGELKAKGLRDKIKVLVGGAPVDKGFPKRSGPTGTVPTPRKPWSWLGVLPASCAPPSGRRAFIGYSNYFGETHVDCRRVDQRQPQVGAGNRRNQDGEGIVNLARDQRDHSANFIDVNAGVFVGKEPELLKWLVTTVQAAVDVPCCIDSPDPRAIEAALAVHKGTAMINSISLEKERYEKLLPLVAASKSKVVALCMSDEGMPETADQRMSIADKLVDGLVKNGVPLENIYLDPLVQPVATNNAFGVEFLQAVERITQTFNGVHTMCGLSNISFGLPERKFINQTFMVMAIARGLDGAIVNPLDERVMGCITAAEMLMGSDSYCMNYLKAYRAGQLSAV